MVTAHTTFVWVALWLAAWEGSQTAPARGLSQPQSVSKQKFADESAASQGIQSRQPLNG